MEFSRQEYRSGLPRPSPEDLPNPGVKTEAPAPQVVSCMQEDSLPAEPPGRQKVNVKQHQGRLYSDTVQNNQVTLQPPSLLP